MATPLWPCRRCGAPGVRNLCAYGYCAWHLVEIYATFKRQADPTTSAPRREPSRADLAFLDEGPTVYGFVMCSSCQRVYADLDEWEICGAQGGKTDEGHYCNGRLRRFTRRTAETRARRAAA